MGSEMKHTSAMIIVLLALTLIVFHVAPVNSATVPITPGETLCGAILLPSGEDGFEFYGNAGDRVAINAVTTSGALNTQMGLVAPSGAYEAGTSYGDDQLNWVLSETGLYTILVMDVWLGGTGEYCITLMKIPGTLSSNRRPYWWSHCFRSNLELARSIPPRIWMGSSFTAMPGRLSGHKCRDNLGSFKHPNGPHCSEWCL